LRQQLIALVLSLLLESLARCSRNHASSSTIKGRLTIELQAPLRAVARDGRQRFRPRFIDRRVGFDRFMAPDRSTALM
jgi:hypothetical protein